MINNNAEQLSSPKRHLLKRLLTTSILPIVWLEYFLAYQAVILVVNSYEHNELVTISLQKLWEFNFWLVGVTVIVTALWTRAVIGVFTKPPQEVVRSQKSKWELAVRNYSIFSVFILSPSLGLKFAILKMPEFTKDFGPNAPKKLLQDFDVAISPFFLALTIVISILGISLIFVEEYNNWRAKRRASRR